MLSLEDLQILQNSFRCRMVKLELSGDYPEKTRDKKLWINSIN